MILVTGGCGFIGSNFINAWLERSCGPVVNLDCLSYAGNALSLKQWDDHEDYQFVKSDIVNRQQVRDALERFRPAAIVHFAAETHVDRSIADADPFVRSNVVGTCHLLAEAQRYWRSLNDGDAAAFRFIHISTDEVYGSLGLEDPPFTEEHPYLPNSPYAASKASSDHFVRSYFSTYEFPAIICHCSNNYGPYQHPEKLIPLLVVNGMGGERLPIYGDGRHERDWLYVEDHCTALRLLLKKGQPGEVYNIGGMGSQNNLSVVNAVCEALDLLCPDSASLPHRNLIQHVTDRPGHDRRYDIDSTKVLNAVGWKPETSFEDGIYKTVEWFLENRDWSTHMLARSSSERVASGRQG